MSPKPSRDNFLVNHHLSREIDLALNELQNIEKLTLGSSREIWWKCQLGHSYAATPYARSKRRAGCPFCGGKRVLKGFNDLASSNPEIASTWHPRKNGQSQPDQVHKGSNTKFWWRCAQEHEWQTSVAKRISGQNCPTCSNRRVEVGVNDLTTTNESVIKYWSSKNTSLPKDFTKGSHEVVWWKCQQGHEFRSEIRYQAEGLQCAECSGARVSPGSTDFFSKYPDLISEWDEARNSAEIPRDLAIGVKKFWWICSNGHSYRKTTAHRARGQGCPICSRREVLVGFNDLATTHPKIYSELVANESGRRPEVTAGSDRKLLWTCSKCAQNYIASVSSRVRGTGCPVCANLKVIAGINDLGKTHPELAKLWDQTKNDLVTPETVVKGSNKKYFWRCSKGHSFKSSPNEMHFQKCPVCSNQLVETGVNDLATLHPEMVVEWSSENRILPSEVVPGSPKKVKWVCPQGHTYAQQINAHVYRRQGCPYCSNTKVLKGFNDLATTHPDLLPEWDVRKNRVAPSEVLAGSNKKFWWICEMGHSWAATGNHRVTGRGCPSCSAGGFDSSAPGTLYWLYHVELHSMKIGITGQDKFRLDNLLAAGWRLLHRWDSLDGAKVRFVETRLLRWIRRDLGLPQHLSPSEMGRVGGSSETFSADVEESTIRQKIVELVKVAESMSETELIVESQTRFRSPMHGS